MIGATPELHPRRVGRVDHRLDRRGGGIEGDRLPGRHPDLATEPPRPDRDRIGRPAGTTPPGPLSELELADVTERRIQRLLDELGGAQTGTLLDWLPIGGPGGT